MNKKMWNAILTYCSYTRNKVTTPKRPYSPKHATTMTTCAYFGCIQETDCLDDWLCVKCNASTLYFCNQSCYYEWLDSPNTIGAWSPRKSSQAPEDIPALKL